MGSKYPITPKSYNNMLIVIYLVVKRVLLDTNLYIIKTVQRCHLRKEQKANIYSKKILTNEQMYDIVSIKKRTHV